jgi:hypothetical protein
MKQDSRVQDQLRLAERAEHYAAVERERAAREQSRLEEAIRREESPRSIDAHRRAVELIPSAARFHEQHAHQHRLMADRLRARLDSPSPR